MRLIKIFLFVLFFWSCDEDPISGLERGWIHNLNSDDSNDDDNQDPIPNETCNIPYETTGTNYSFVSPSKSIYRFGDSYNVTLSGTFSIGQVDGVYLILNPGCEDRSDPTSYSKKKGEVFQRQPVKNT